MPSKQPLITFNVSPDLKRAIRNASNKAGMTQSAWLRKIIAEACKTEGIEPPAVLMEQHGGARQVIE